MGSDTEDHRHSWTFTGLSVDAQQQLIGREMVFEQERAEQALLYHGTLPILARSFPLRMGVSRSAAGLDLPSEEVLECSPPQDGNEPR